MSSPSSLQAQSEPEQGVVVRFDHGQKDWSQFFELEQRLRAAIAEAGVGEYDGNELAVDGSDGSIYMYGPSADRLWATVKPLLQSAHFLKNSRARLRYGSVFDANAREVLIDIGR